jgi:competence protein CoiA
MLIARNRHGEVLAAEVQPQDGPFHCPECEEPVILKQGRVKVAHFAHYPGVDCTYAAAGEGEGEEHRRAKQEIFQALLQVPGVRDVRLERSLQGVRPDVICRINGEMVAIEVQLSRLSISAIESRTRAYAARRIAVLWTPPMPDGVLKARYAPKDWERYLHTLYYGKVYYWSGGLTLRPVRFREYRLASGWYAGTRRSKRYVSPLLLPAVSLTDLAPVWRKPWRDWPRAKLWTEPWDDQ